MSNVLNPEPESITLNTELETPTLEPATEQEQPSYESTSNPDTAEAPEAVELSALDADATTEPVAEAALGRDLPRLRGVGRLPGGTAAGKTLEERDGAGLPRG